MYLFKIGLKVKGVPSSYSTSKSKPIYLVARNKESVLSLANDKIRSHLEVTSLSKLAVQLAPYIFSGDMK